MNSLKTDFCFKSPNKNEPKDVKNSLDRKAIWERLSPSEKEFFKELNKKLNTEFIHGNNPTGELS